MRSFRIKDLGVIPARSLKNKDLEVKYFPVNKLEGFLVAGMCSVGAAAEAGC